MRNKNVLKRYVNYLENGLLDQNNPKELSIYLPRLQKTIEECNVQNSNLETEEEFLSIQEACIENNLPGIKMGSLENKEDFLINTNSRQTIQKSCVEPPLEIKTENEVKSVTENIIKNLFPPRDISKFLDLNQSLASTDYIVKGRENSTWEMKEENDEDSLERFENGIDIKTEELEIKEEIIDDFYETNFSLEDLLAETKKDSDFSRDFPNLFQTKSLETSTYVCRI